MNTDMKLIELEFEGRDAHAVSTYICLFEQQFKDDPTDAAHQLKRNLESLVEANRRNPEKLAVRDSRVVSLRDRRRDRVSGRSEPTYPDAG